MPGIPTLLSMALLIAGSASVACVHYAGQGNFHLRLNRMMLCMGICLFIWSFGLALVASASGPFVAFLGCRIAPLGYAPLFGFWMIFVLELTGHPKLLAYRWSRPLLFLPACVTVLGFSILPLFGMPFDANRQTALGWVSATQNPWVWFYYIYYGMYFLASAALLAARGIKSGPGNNRRQAFTLFASVLGAGALGTLTDILLQFFGVEMPSVASVFSIIQVAAVSYCVKRFGLMKPPAADPEEIILNKASRVGYQYRMIGLSLFAAGFVMILFGDLTSARNRLNVPGLLLAAAGLLTFAVFRFCADDALRELQLALLCCVLIPVCALWNADGFAGWAVTFVLLVPAVLCNRHTLLVTVIVSTLAAGLVAIGTEPVARGAQTVFFAYPGWGGLLVITMALCVFAHSVYWRRLRENARHAARQMLIARVTQLLLNAGEDTDSEPFASALRECGLYLQCGSALFITSEGSGSTCRCEWNNPALPDEALAEESVRELLAAAENALQYGGVLTVEGALSVNPVWTEAPTGAEEASAAPPSARFGALLGALRRARLNAFTAVPVRQCDRITGLFCFGAREISYRWAPDTAEFLTLIANIAADMLTRLGAVHRAEYLAYHDQLTGLPNRSLFMDRLSQATALGDRSAKMVAVMFLDVDHFKSINDAMGYATGDLLLIELAKALERRVRRYDTVARFGGDEFVLFLSQLDRTADLTRIMEHLMETVRQPITLRNREFFLTASAGVSVFPQDGQDEDTLLANANIAMYRAKSLGENRFVLCSQNMKLEAVEQMKLANLLYRAQERGQLTVYYQPQVSIPSGRIVGFEALLRWKLPGQGIIGPDVFIPFAEKTGLIQSIGAWVLETACRQARLWADRGFGALRMAVNVSVQQFRSPHFVNLVADTLRRTGLSPAQLELEVTESVANSGDLHILTTFTKLKKLGVSISIDDFGTEYSSLNRLKLLPVDRLKLDIHFVRSIGTSEKDRAVTRAIIALAKSLRMKVIAEGVETKPQLDFLADRMCDEVQGFYYYRPMPAAAAENILKAAAGAANNERLNKC